MGESARMAEIPILVPLESVPRKKTHEKKPLTILTGFLGSGKSTLLSQLQKTDRDIGIVLNEYSDSTDIEKQIVKTKDGDINVLEFSKGCLCCTLKTTTVSLLEQVAERVSHVVLELSGLADPAVISNMVNSCECDLFINKIICLVDSQNWRRSSKLDEFKRQLVFANSVIITKAKSKSDFLNVKMYIESLNIECEVRDLLEIDVCNVDAFLEPIEQKVFEVLPLRHTENIACEFFTTFESVDLELCEKWIQSVLWEKDFCWRVKGIVSSLNRTVIIQGVYDQYDITDCAVAPYTKFIFIGKSIPFDLKEDFMRKCIIRRK